MQQRILTSVVLCVSTAGATVTLAAPSIAITPSPVIAYPGESVQLSADIRGPSEYRVKWILQGPMMDGVDPGELTEGGLYTAPQYPPPGPVRIVVQISTGQWNLPVAAASVPVQIVPEGVPKPEFKVPPPPPPPAFPRPDRSIPTFEPPGQPP